MRKMLLISLLLAWPAAALTADDAQCDAKPFTLNKPKPAAQKPSGGATADAAKVKTPKPAPKTGQAKPKPIADCKEPKKA